MRLWAGFLIWLGLVGSPVEAKQLPVPLVRQSTEYSCGAAVLLAVLAYYGDLRWNETDLMKKAGTTTDGTDLIRLTRVANDLGLTARWQDQTTLDQIRNSLAQKNPVIVEAQAWAEDPKQSYAEVWNAGHYLVIVDIDEEKITFMDPAHLGSHGFWTIPEFLDRWHDISAGGLRRQHTAMFVEGLPQPPVPLLPIP